MIKKKTSVILFGDYVAAYGVIRALGPIGIPIFLVSSENRYNLCRWSRYVRGFLFLPTDTTNYVDKLVSWGMHNVGKNAVLMVAGADEPLDVLSRLLPELPSGWKATFPDSSVVDIVREKHLTYKVAEEVGVSFPKTFLVKSGDDLSGLLEGCKEMMPPFLVKAEKSKKFFLKYKTKGMVFQSLGGVRDFLSKNEVEGSLLVQEMIPGDESFLLNFIGVYGNDGILRSCFMNKKARSSARFLSCTLMTPFFSQSLILKSNLIARNIGFKGYFNSEYKFDSRDGKSKLMEINGRVSLSNSHALRSGINLPLAMYRDALSLPNKDSLEFIAKKAYSASKRNILWWLPLGELGNIRSAIAGGWRSIGKYIDEMRGDGYIVEPFFWKDPLPGFFVLFCLIASVVIKTLKKLF